MNKMPLEAMYMSVSLNENDLSCLHSFSLLTCYIEDCIQKSTCHTVICPREPEKHSISSLVHRQPLQIATCSEHVQQLAKALLPDSIPIVMHNFQNLKAIV